MKNLTVTVSGDLSCGYIVKLLAIDVDYGTSSLVDVIKTL